MRKATKLLLIEDNPGDSRLIQEIIRESSAGTFELHEAIDLASGLSTAQREQVQALLLDLALPDSTGLETFEAIHAEIPHLPVIILSGTSDEALALKAVRGGAQDYFVKGQIDGTLLIRALGYAIERSRRERDLEIIASVTFSMRTTQDPDEVVSITLDSAHSLMETDAAAVMLLDESRTNLRFAGAIGSWEATTGERLELEGTLVQDVLDSGKPYYESNLQDNPDPRLEHYRRLDERLDTLVLIPLIAEQETIGVMAIADGHEIDQHDFNAFQTVANIAANNIHRALLFKRTQRQLEHLNSLRTIDLAINTSVDLSITLKVLLDQVTSQLKVDASQVLLLDPLNALHFKVGRGFNTTLSHSTSLRPGEGNAGQAVKERRVVRLPNISTGSQHANFLTMVTAEKFVSQFCAPLESRGSVVGVLEVFHRSPLEPNEEWFDFFETLAGQAAIAIQNAELFENLREAKNELEFAYDATLEGWVRALDMRDEETEGHTQRVTEMSLKLAKLAGFGNEELPPFWRGALLHDIGKIAIPDAILRKAGPLNEDEWTTMKMHPGYARQLLAPIDYLRLSIDIPYRHHEKWDGSGYPSGLKGEEIPLTARLFSIIDVWDALRSDRPYRKAWSNEKAWDHIRSQSGQHFDPEIVKIFESHFIS